ncbi:MAG: Ig-like domain-containing protein [Muribaculaceae bacterium]|nr:Ig-like domain-containing protein [Muribaculaceae bacterium]
MRRSKLTPLQWLLVAVVACIAAACASIGRPEGGPKDVAPPVFVGARPANGALGVDRQNIDIFFNENVQLADVSSKVIVSPVQKNMPAISANGRHVSVQLKDTLQPNTTYTIDFGDAIKDLNEGNVLDGFTYAFSTGDSIDSLRISGMVFEAKTLEPAQGMLVGIHSDLSDTAISSVPLLRVARTNQLGQFTISNVKPGRYRVYALNDLNRDYKWDRSEDVAFATAVVEPYATTIEVVDTLRSHLSEDSLVARAGTAYFPNDVLLTWFNEGYSAQYVKDYARPDRRRITISMGAPADTLPEITLISGPMTGQDISSWARLKANPTLDSLEYWIFDESVLATDSLYLSVKALRTDTADMLTWRTDTLKFFFKDPAAKKTKKKGEEQADTLPPEPTFISFSAATGPKQDVHRPVVFNATEPIGVIDAAGVTMEVKVDTLWEKIPGVKFVVDSTNALMRRKIEYKWEPGASYRITVDSAAVTNIYGEHNNQVKHEFTVRTLEEYSNLTFSIAGLDTLPAVVELLNKSDAVIATAPVVNGRAVFRYLNPGQVYARLYIDANANGKWDPGSIADWRQPEEVYYFDKKINLRANWDVTQDWDIYAVPVDQQKPYDIKKNKPKLKAGEKPPTDPADEEEDDPFATGFGSAGRNQPRR